MKKVGIILVVSLMLLSALAFTGCGGIGIQEGKYALKGDPSAKINVVFREEDGEMKGKIGFEQMDVMFAKVEDCIKNEMQKPEDKRNYSVVLKEEQTLENFLAEFDISMAIGSTFAWAVAGDTIDIFVPIRGYEVEIEDKDWGRTRTKDLELRFVYSANDKTITLDMSDSLDFTDSQLSEAEKEAQKASLRFVFEKE